jgi:hypothetical protein
MVVPAFGCAQRSGNSLGIMIKRLVSWVDAFVTTGGFDVTALWLEPIGGIVDKSHRQAKKVYRTFQ